MTTTSSMVREIRCPECGKKLKARIESVGRKGKCPVCQTVFQVDAFSPKIAVSKQDISEKPPKVFTPPSETHSMPAIITEPQDKKILICHWCSQEMPVLAKNCSHCGKLRKDIYNAKVAYYTFMIVSGLLLIGAVALTSKMSVENHWWSVKVERTPIPVSEGASFLGQLIQSTAERFTADMDKTSPQYKFSVEKFLSSGSGIFLIILFAVYAVANIYLGRRVSKKLGTRIWI